MDCCCGDWGVGEGGAEGEVGVGCCAGVRFSMVVRVQTEMGGVCERERSETDPKGSPTTRNATSTLSASFRISSEEDSTISRSAKMRGRP